MKHPFYQYAHKLFILSVLLCAPYYVLAQHETKAAPHEFEFRALSAEEGRHAFVDESVEPYFSVLQVLEIAALTRNPAPQIEREDQLVALRNQARTQLQAQVSEFTPGEAALLQQIAMRIDELLAVDYPLIAAQPWKILKLDSSCCATAHTRSDSIILAQHGIDELMRLWEESHDIDEVLAGRGSLLLHEQIHIIQRYHPELFAELYHELWGFTHIAPIRESPWLQKHVLHNPDAYDLGFLLAFDSGTGDSIARQYQLRTLLIPRDPAHPKMGKDFRSVAIETQRFEGSWHYRQDNSGMPVYIAFEDFEAFSHPLEGLAPHVALERGGDHPHEILAYSFEAILRHQYLNIPLENSNDKKAVERIGQLVRLMLREPAMAKRT